MQSRTAASRQPDLSFGAAETAELSAATLHNWPLPTPDRSADKEDRGKVLLIAGSREIPGAAWLAATAALRAGAGKVTIATANSVATGLALALPETRVVGLRETPEGGLDPKDLHLLENHLRGCSAVLAGPGLLDSDATCALLEGLLKHSQDVPILLDALAMDVLHRREPFSQQILLTPHAGEMAHLTGISKEDVQAHAQSVALEMSQQKQAIVVLKGATSWIATPKRLCWRHSGGNVGLATSGSGDVLAGLMVGLMARGTSLAQAACWGVVLHALAGQELAERVGPLGFLARELPAEIPALMRGL